MKSWQWVLVVVGFSGLGVFVQWGADARSVIRNPQKQREDVAQFDRLEDAVEFFRVPVKMLSDSTVFESKMMGLRMLEAELRIRKFQKEIGQ